MSKLSFSIYIAFFATLCNASYDITVVKAAQEERPTRRRRRRPSENSSMTLFNISFLALNLAGAAGTGVYFYTKKDDPSPPHTSHTTSPNNPQREILPLQDNIKTPNMDDYLKGKVYLIRVTKENCNIPDDNGEKYIYYIEGGQKRKTKLEYYKDEEEEEEEESDECYCFKPKNFGIHFFEEEVEVDSVKRHYIPYIFPKPTKAYVKELEELNQQNPSKEIDVTYIIDGKKEELRPNYVKIKKSNKFNPELSVRDLINLVIFNYLSSSFTYEQTYIYGILFPFKLPPNAFINIDNKLKGLKYLTKLTIRVGKNNELPAPRDCEYQFIEGDYSDEMVEDDKKEKEEDEQKEEEE